MPLLPPSPPRWVPPRPFGEFAGASNNPEVVAPLDKLRSLIEPRSAVAGDVEFYIDGRVLRGVLRNTDKLSYRS